VEYRNQTFSSSPNELNAVPELGSSGIDTIYGSNNPLLKSECSGLTDFSIHDSLANSNSFSSIINQESEFSKSLMSLRSDALDNDGVNSAEKNHFSQSNGVNHNASSAFSSPVIPLGSTNRGILTRAHVKEYSQLQQQHQTLNEKSPNKRKIQSQSEVANPPRKIVRFSSTSKSGESPEPCGASQVERNGNEDASVGSCPEKETPIKGTRSSSRPKFFTQGPGNRESLKNAAIANVKLNKTAGSNKRSRSKLDKTPETPAAQSTTNFVSTPKPDVAQTKSAEIDHKTQPQRPQRSQAKTPGAKLSNAKTQITVEEQEKIVSPPSPPPITLSKPKITYGRSVKKSTASLPSSEPQQPALAPIRFQLVTSDAIKPDAVSCLPTTPTASQSPQIPSTSSYSSSHESPSTSQNAGSQNSFLVDDPNAGTAIGIDPLSTPSTISYQDIASLSKYDSTSAASTSNSKEGGNGANSNLKEKKKKKRNPVIIHDHITVISGNLLSNLE
jgi:hypothetical protein